MLAVSALQEDVRDLLEGACMKRDVTDHIVDLIGQAQAGTASEGFWYLGTPYSKFPSGLDSAYSLAVMTRGLLLKAGVRVFSPIVHSHVVAMTCGMDPFDHKIWLPAEAPIMAAAKGLIVLCADSWEISTGLKHEEAEFYRTNRPIVYMHPGIVPGGLTDA